MKSPNCPVCYSNSIESVRTISAAEAAQHFVLFEENAKRNGDLECKIKEIWERDDCEILKCKNCEFGFAYPYRSGDPEFYELAYPRSGYPKMKWEFDRTLSEMKSLPLDGKRAIDVGAGEGFFLDLLKNRFFGADSLWGTEYNASAAEKIENKGFNVYNGDVRDALFDTNRLRFDFITMFQVVEHMDNIDTLFAMLKKMSNQDAHIFIAVPNMKVVEYNERTHSLLDMPPAHIGRWNPKAFEIMARRHGLILVAHEVEPLRISDFIKRDLIYSHLRTAQISGTLSNKCRSIQYEPIRKAFESICILISAPLRLRYWVQELWSDRELGGSLWVHLTNR